MIFSWDHVLIAGIWGAVLFALTWLLLRLFPKSISPKIRLVVWTLILLRFCLPFQWETSWSLDLISWDRYQGVAGTRVPSSPNSSIQPDTLQPLPASAGPASQSGSSRATLWPWTWLWAAGTLGYLALVAGSYIRFRWKVSQALPLDEGPVNNAVETLFKNHRGPLPIIRETALVTSPALLGWCQPIVLVPMGSAHHYTEAEWIQILSHEKSHMDRHDILLNWWMILAQAMHWWNPAVWLTTRNLRRDRELVCDAMVLKGKSLEEKTHYGLTLIKLAEQPPRSSLTFLAPVAHPTHLEQRIHMITKSTPEMRRVLVVAVLALAVGIALTLLTPPKEDPAVLALRKELKNSQLQHAFEKAGWMRDSTVLARTTEAKVIANPSLKSLLEKTEAEYFEAKADVEAIRQLDRKEMEAYFSKDEEIRLLRSKMRASESEGQTLLSEFGEQHPKVRATKEAYIFLHESQEKRFEELLQEKNAEAQRLKVKLELLREQIHLKQASSQTLKSSMALRPTKPVILEIEKDGTFVLNGTAVARDELEKVLSQSKPKEGEPILQIHAKGGVALHQSVEAISIGQHAGYHLLDLKTN